MTTTPNHLKRRSQFLRVAASGLKWVTPGVIVQARHRGDADTDMPAEAAPGIGLTVSRKVGNAVKRNRARRRLWAVANDVVAHHGDAGFDYVLIGRHTTLTRPFRDLVGDLNDAMVGIGRKAARSGHKAGAT